MSITDLPPIASPRGDAMIDIRAVVVVRGEHDIATAAVLYETLDRAMLLHDVDIVVDLRDVRFMDASTVGILIAARNRLRGWDRTLTFAVPSPPARRVLELCRLAHLIEPDRATIALTGSVLDVRIRG
jgi:anti-anti-sigma factor